VLGFLVPLRTPSKRLFQTVRLLLQLVLDPNSPFDELIPVDEDFLQNYVSELSGMNVDTVGPCFFWNAARESAACVSL
jgi:hypothetical protein